MHLMRQNINGWGYRMPAWEIWAIVICVLFGAGTVAIGLATFLPYHPKPKRRFGFIEDEEAEPPTNSGGEGE